MNPVFNTRSFCAYLVLPCLFVTIAGCSSVSEMLEPEKIDYKGATKSSGKNKLEVPPDLRAPRSNNAYNLPPGPNSPVGIVWMGINRPSIGMHGTNTPDRIGRNESSGCIRLANWDAFRLYQLVKSGTRIEVR